MTPNTRCLLPVPDPLLHEIVAVEVERMEEKLQREYGIVFTPQKRRRWERKILRWVSRDLCRAIRASKLPTSTMQKSIDCGLLHMQCTEIRNALRDSHSQRLRYAFSAFLDVLSVA